MADTFPYGYRPDASGVLGMGSMLTMPVYETMTTVKNLHPEVWRRFKALMQEAHRQNVPLGVGTGWRIQPNPPPSGFAKPGNSWHESCPVNPTSSSALAIDTVPNISWDWMEINLVPYGLRSFRTVNDEPWHVQPAEISPGRNFATTLPPLDVWDLPGDETTPPSTAWVAAIHDEGDPMFIASKNGKYWIGNGLGRRVCDDNAEADFLITKFKASGKPLRNLQNGAVVDTRSEVTDVPQMDQLGVNVGGD